MDNVSNPDRHVLLEQLFVDLNSRLADATKIAALAAELKSFKEQMAAQFQSQKEQVALAMTSAKEAVTKAEVASDKRFEGVNEFRLTLSDQQRTLMPRQEAEVSFKGLAEKHDAMNRALTDKLVKLENELIESRGGKSGIREGWGYAVGVIGLILLLLSVATAVGSRI